MRVLGDSEISTRVFAVVLRRIPDVTILIALAIALSSGLLAAACSARPPLQSEDPQVQTAQQACKDLRDPERFACIERQAITTLNPDVCRLIGIAVDDACLQAVYEAADDPAICDRLYLPGVVRNCKDYFADPNHVPRLLTPTPIPDDARLIPHGRWQSSSHDPL